MKELFEKYYSRLEEYYKKEFGVGPTVVYKKELDKDMVTSKKDKDGYVTWAMKPVNDVDLSEFKLKGELKDYFTTYRFFRLEGSLDGINFYFDPVYGDIKKKVEVMQKDGKYYKRGCYCLGTAERNGNDGLVVLYKKGKVYLYDGDKKKKEKLRYTLSEIIEKMEVNG